MWQFSDGKEYDDDEFMVVSLNQIILVDPSVKQLLYSLSIGFEATRKSKETECKITKTKD